MDVIELLDVEGERIVTSAVECLRRCHLRHYEAEGPERVRERLNRLFELMREAVRTRNAEPMNRHAREVAAERFASGYDLLEVQTAFNALEEAVWARALAFLEPGELARALGLVSTVLGMGKDALARAYVSLAAEGQAPSLDLRELFKGTV